ncbi:shikimate kinase [Propionibacteriaceae bacterium G1746]|uniref:shikimate kinase n=1 Tax=Aestuariimicrobium sp. G57 TaxID=3418485 RepID=UPI003C187D19
MSVLVLVGPPASGKSTVGQALAARLGVPFIDVDAAIEASTGMTIGEIFVDLGEPEFRRLEREATLELVQRDAVVSLGGGAVMSPEIRAALAGHLVCWLQVSVVHATRRVGMNAMRPLLLGDVRANLQKLLTEREPFYREVADITIDTTNLKADEVVADLARRLGADATGQEQDKA